MYSNLTYSDIAVEFGARLPDWTKLEGFVTDAIVRDAFVKLSEFWSFWNNRPEVLESVRNRREGTLQAFVKNYIEVVESLPICKDHAEPTNQEIWTVLGTTLRLLEVG